MAMIDCQTCYTQKNDYRRVVIPCPKCSTRSVKCGACDNRTIVCTNCKGVGKIDRNRN